MSVIFTLHMLLGRIRRSRIPFDQAWIVITESGVMDITDLSEFPLSKVPLEDRIGGPCSHVRATELFDLIRWKFGEDILGMYIKPYVRRFHDGTVQTDIIIGAPKTNFLVNAPAFIEQKTAEIEAG